MVAKVKWGFAQGRSFKQGEVFDIPEKEFVPYLMEKVAEPAKVVAVTKVTEPVKPVAKKKWHK